MDKDALMVIGSEYEGDFIMNQPAAFHMILVRDGVITGGYTNLMCLWHDVY